ncbi:MAG: putative LPS assembly protein LptD, partial [bacterium]
RTLSTPFEGLALRHVVSPSVQISYSPDFPGLSYTDENGILRPRFKGFADVNLTSGARSTVGSFTLDQRLQAKLTRGERVTRLDNLLSWTTSGSYDFRWRENGRSHGLSALSSALRLQPPGWVNADANAIVDPYQGRPLRSLGWNVYTSFGNRGGGRPQAARSATDSERGVSEGEEAETAFRDNWTVSLAYSSSGGYFGPSWSSREALNAVFRYQITEGWLFDYSAGYDLTDRRVQLQRFNLTRRIHCWDATFTRSFTPGGETEYYLRLGIREQREIYLERGTRVQSFGGIQ